MDILRKLQSILEDLSVISEAVRNQRQDLRHKGLQPHKQHPHRKFERRATREAGTKRRVQRSGYNAGQRDRYKHSRTGVKADGKKGKIKPRRKALGSVLNPRKPLRTRIR